MTRITIQIDDDSAVRVFTAEPVAVETSLSADGGAAQGGGASAESARTASAGDAIDAGGPPPWLIDALPDVPTALGLEDPVSAEEAASASDGGAAPAG